jgi:ParB family transcriptional regulator, chromosome partitioning protein
VTRHCQTIERVATQAWALELDRRRLKIVLKAAQRGAGVSEKRRGLGRGLGALIPPPPPARNGGDRPVDVFFSPDGETPADGTASSENTSRTREPDQGGPQPAATDPAPAANGDSAASNSGATRVDGEPTQPNGAKSTNGKATNGKAGTPTSGNAQSNGASAEPELVPVPGAYFAEIPVTSISPNPKQPRQVFDEESLAELTHSVREIGVLQPIVVRSVPTADGDEARFELIMGERRWRASELAGLDRIPAIVRDTSDDDLLRDALLENLHRSDLNPLEEAAAYQQLLDDFGCTHEELATRIRRSRPQISNTIRLLRLPPAVQRRVAAGVLSAGHARALLGLEDADAMDKLAQRIVSEGLSVRTTEEAVAISDSDSPAPPRRKPPRAGTHRAELDDLATRLADRLDTRVNISLGRNKGKISVEFASVEDLNRILEILAPEERKAFQSK